MACGPTRLILALALSAAIAPAASAQALSPAFDSTAFLPPSFTGETADQALECVALAISYEAGLEPIAGQEAVAQVILNRVRHRSYPNSVCGVVWQGSTRRTGCQFTFTCDGSLLRPRSPASMAAARAVARRVLTGESPDHVQGATHYHASYVSPYWAPSLIRIRQIATHIFYRSPGSPAHGEGLPVTFAHAAPEVSKVRPTPGRPAVQDGVFAPWGLTVSAIRR